VKAVGDENVVRQVLDDYTTAPDPRLRAALCLINTLALTPAAVTSADVKPLFDAGVSRQAVADAIYVCFLFSTYTRLADTLGWEVPSQGSFEASARILLTRGYG
jgi:alkylhydroperoxidase family enzyme